jgi:hypothetical protein
LKGRPRGACKSAGQIASRRASNALTARADDHAAVQPDGGDAWRINFDGSRSDVHLRRMRIGLGKPGLIFLIEWF